MPNMSEKKTVPTKKPVRVYIDGCYDFTHYGHYNALRQARALGDELIVGVHSDVEIDRVKRPSVYPENERYRLVNAVKWVSKVVEDVLYRVDLDILDEHGCDFCVHGDDPVLLEDGSDCFQVAKDAGRYKEVKRTVGISTTDLINRIVKRTREIKAAAAAQPPTETASLNGSTESEPVSGAQSSNNTNNHHHPASVVREGNGLSDFPCLHSPVTYGMPHIPNVLQLGQFVGLGAGAFQPTADGIREPQPGETVVYAPGTFDLFHYGHLCFIEKCLQLGSYLIIGLYDETDAYHENLPYGTIMTLQERLLCILPFKGIANVLIGAPYVITKAMLDHFKIDIVAVGSNNKMKPAADGTDPFQVPRKCGILRTVNSGSSVTTTTVIKRVLQHESQYVEINHAKEAKERAAASSHQKPTLSHP